MRISFVFVTDRRGFPLAQYAILAAALAEPLSHDFHLFCHRFTPGAEADALRAAVSAAGGRLHLHAIENEDLARIPAVGHVSSASFLRVVAIDTIARNSDRVVYLDTDTLVFEGLGIEQIDMEGRTIAAVLDMDLSETGVFRTEVGTGFHDPAMRSRFFNAGVLIVDTTRWQETFIARFAEAMAEQEHHCRFKLNCPTNDQCALNIMFEDDWTPLPFTYNFQAGGKFTQDWQTAKIRHYCGAAKFLPVTLRRNDPRDLALIGELGRRLGHGAPNLTALYAVAFRVNAWRNRDYARQMRRFIQFAEPRRA